MPKFYSELQEAHVENVAADPATPAVGRFWRNTVSNLFKFYDGVSNKVMVTETGSATLTNKTLTSPTINSPTIATPTIDVELLTEQGSSPATPSAGVKKLYAKTDGKVYTLSSAGLEQQVGAGGGGINLLWDESANSPTFNLTNGQGVYDFGAGLSQELYTSFRLPASYSTGSPVTIKILILNGDTSGNFLIRAQSTLVRSETDAYSSTTNQRTTTNAAITATGSTQNKWQKVTLDVSSSTGTVNSVAASAADVLLIRLYRDTDTATGDISFLIMGCEVTTS